VKHDATDFRELIERVLPLDELPRGGGVQFRRAPWTGVSAEIERAGLLTLEKLGQRDAIGRLGTPGSAGNRAAHHHRRDGPEVATVEISGSREQDGLLLYPRTALPAQARGGLHQVRRLLRLDDPMLSSDPRRADARTVLAQQLNQAGRELLGANELRFLPVSDEAEESGRAHLAPALSSEVRAHPDTTYYCPDTSRSRALAAEAGRRGARSVVMTGVSSPRGETLGLLEVTSAERDAFRPDDLAMIALLADYWAGVLERAVRIEKLVFIDPLTSAYNRSYFDLQVQNEMARAAREKSSMALCIADIDDFKKFNTIFGFEAGNQVLVQVAQSLRGGVRPFDTVARWGGEEFGVLLTAPVQAHDVVTISERLRATVERQSVQLEALDRSVHRAEVTVSIGVALFPDHARDATDLWRAANQALLLAKRPPKNQVVFFRPPEAGR
jgi:diguanylate cyclase (GGDEF)-like protein